MRHVATAAEVDLDACWATGEMNILDWEKSARPWQMAPPHEPMVEVLRLGRRAIGGGGG